jgi:hypothetical protein
MKQSLGTLGVLGVSFAVYCLTPSCSLKTEQADWGAAGGADNGETTTSDTSGGGCVDTSTTDTSCDTSTGDCFDTSCDTSTGDCFDTSTLYCPDTSSTEGCFDTTISDTSTSDPGNPPPAPPPPGPAQ